MSNGLQKYDSSDLKGMLEGASVQRSFEKVLGEKARGFVTSVLQIVNDSKMLSNANPNSVLNAAMTAATLDLPINPNLGFAYIIPYNNKGGTVAQFQMGYKGYIQLCQRSGLFKTISATEIYEGQIIEENPLTGFEFNFKAKSSNKVVGYAAYFELLNGFQKTFYMSKEQVTDHAKNYSQSFKKEKPTGPWKDHFDDMAIKTVLKLLLSKFAPMTVDIEKAIQVDQAEVKDVNSMKVAYPDNPKNQEPETTSVDFEEEENNPASRPGEQAFQGVDMSDFKETGPDSDFK